MPSYKQQQASDGARYVFLTSFSILSAFLLRDIFQGIWNHLLKVDKLKFWKSVGIQVALFLLVFIITLIMAIFWTSYDTFSI